MFTTDNLGMGKVLTTLKIINRSDEILAARAVISQEQVRSITLKNVLVDTGATTLCLPSRHLRKLIMRYLKTL